MTAQKLPLLLTTKQLDREFIQQVEPDWHKLLTCFQCGTCSASCPAAELMDYAPRQLWQLIRLGMRDVVMNSRTFWLCTQCYACQVRCPRGIHISETMRHLRERAVAGGYEIPAAITNLRGAVNATYNILNEDNATRMIWSQNLEPVPVQLQHTMAGRAEALLFTGCVSSFYPMAYSIPQSFIQILEQADVTYTTMGGAERCCGYPLYGAGMREDVDELAKHNIAQARELAPTHLVATCASCYHTWRHLYPEYTKSNGNWGFDVLHASEYLAQLIAEGRIKLAALDWVVTYHDPCDLGRKNNVYEAPRAIIKAIPQVTFKEMANHGADALCCGGGGDVAMMEPDAVEHMAEQRLAQAVDTGATAIISSCQQCKRTLLQAARKTRTRIRILDVTELVWQAMEKKPMSNI
ncbi:MAG TPA: (Fe-S)-binding protein [Anaerolineae bacterium]|nr:(Fe-S)-binding protein [Anaerolineae bacterium]